MNMALIILLLGSFLVLSGCTGLMDPRIGYPIGRSSDSNGQPCETYQTRSDSVYITFCGTSAPWGSYRIGGGGSRAGRTLSGGRVWIPGPRCWHGPGDG